MMKTMLGLAACSADAVQTRAAIANDCQRRRFETMKTGVGEIGRERASASRLRKARTPDFRPRTKFSSAFICLASRRATNSPMIRGYGAALGWVVAALLPVPGALAQPDVLAGSQPLTGNADLSQA